jgi:hypothetical protein
VQNGRARADDKRVMRFVRSLVLALMLALALAPTAIAHDEAEPDHRDAPADLVGANITRTLAIAQLAGTAPPNLPQYMPTNAWCGSRQTADVTEFAAFPATQRQIKVVYAYASGEADRSAQWSDALQADVSNIEQYLALQTGGQRALRFDMGTECGPQYVDIQTVALPRDRTYYRDDPTNFDRLAHDVAAAIGSQSGPRDVFILADKLTDDPVWGIAEVLGDDSPGASNASNVGGLTAIMWTNPSTQPDPSDWWQPTVMLHEITHNLGGVQQSAPNHTSNWHCIDGEDVMCYADGALMAHPYEDDHCPLSSDAIPQTYDCGHDDYYDPSPATGSYLATHWNTFNSPFLGSCQELLEACGGEDHSTPADQVPFDVDRANATWSRLFGSAGHNGRRIRVRIRRTQLVVRHRGVIAWVRCRHDCTVASRGLALQIAGRARRVGPRRRAIPGGVAAKVTLRLKSHSLRHLRRRLAGGRSAGLRVALRVRDSAGAQRRVVRRIRAI